MSAEPMFLSLNPRNRLEIATTIERLINMLDDLDPDPDLEPEPDLEEGGDAEPYLGWPEQGLSALRDGAPHDDRELEDEHDEDGGDDEPTLGWTIGGARGDCSLSDDHEADPAEMGIADADAFHAMSWGPIGSWR